MSALPGTHPGQSRPSPADKMSALRLVGQPLDRSAAVLTAVLALCGAVSSYIAALPWLRAYQVPGAPWLLLASAVAPLAISAVLTRALRFHSLVSFAASAAGLVVTLFVVNDFDFSTAWDGLSHVPAQLLSETLPLGGPAYLLAAPMALTWACSFFCAEGALRSGRPMALPLAAPAAYFVLSFAATTSAPAGPTAQEAAALLGALAAMALARHGLLDTLYARAATAAPDPESQGESLHPRHSSLRRAGAGALCGAVVAAGLGAALPRLSALSSRPLAVSRPTQLLGGTIVEPVDTMAALRTTHLWSRPLVMMSVKVRGPWDGYLSMGIMSSYDGGSWGFSPLFRPTGGRVPADYVLAGSTVRQTYVLRHSLPVALLPAVERPVQVSGAAVDADSATGMLAAAGPEDATYRIVSRAPGATGAQLPSSSTLLSPGDVPGGDGKALTQLPAGALRFLAPAVRYAVNLTGQPATASFSFLQALAASLRADEKWAVPSRAHDASLPAALTGTSLAQVMNAVTVDRAATPEQFATFLAVVGRDLGAPVRLVTGFRVPRALRGGTARPSSYRVTAADAWTWDEVPVAGYGWVVLDPTPASTTTNVSAPPEQVQAAKPHKPKPATALPAQVTRRAVAHPVTVPHLARHSVDWALTLGAGLPLALVLALAVVVLGVPAARRRLRRLGRQRSDDPALMAAGAWLELVDGLSRLGLEVAPSATSREVAERVTQRFGGEFGPPAAVVGTLADRAIYSSRFPLDAGTARVAWDSQRALYRAIRKAQPAGVRARSLMAVGSAPARPLAQVRR